MLDVINEEENIMNVLENIFTFLQIFVGIIVLILVLLQDGKDDGNVIVANKGGAMGTSKDEKIAKLTKYIGIAYIVLTIISSSIMLINK